MGIGERREDEKGKHVGTVCKSLLHKDRIVYNEWPFLHEISSVQILQFAYDRDEVK